VNKTLTAFNVPGIAVAIIKDGKVVRQGYGVKSKYKEKVDANTYWYRFSKAFTSASLAY
jgi:CubicO group peptidase (beta-lactamase class C family)